jgi:hypothetical protein
VGTGKFVALAVLVAVGILEGATVSEGVKDGGLETVALRV